MYFAFLHSNIIHDPKGYLLELIKKRKVIWSKNVPTEIILSLVQLSVILKFEDNWRGLMTETHYNKSVSRNDFVSTHRVLNLGFELILDLLYLLKGNPPPDFKNKIRLCNYW